MTDPAATALPKKSNKTIEWLIIIVAVALIGVVAYLVYRLVVSERRQDFTRPSLVTYNDKAPKSIKVSYQTGKDTGVAGTTNDTVTLEWTTSDEVKAFLYITPDKKEQVGSVIEATLKNTNSNVSVTPTPTSVDAGTSKLQVIPIGATEYGQEDTTGKSDEGAIGGRPAYEGDWVNFDSNTTFSKDHKAVIDSSLVAKYRTFLKLNEEAASSAPANDKPSTNELYYYIIQIDKNGNSYPYGDEALTFNDSGPTQGYVLSLPQTFTNTN